MTRIELLLYLEPCFAEVYVSLKPVSGETHYRIAATVDTGAETSFFPLTMLSEIEHSIVRTRRSLIEQAGIPEKVIEVTECVVTMFLEDLSGMRTKEFEATVWFADTTETLVGFKDILDRATLYIDYREKREGWIELD
jgi:hypothetical protein